MSYPVGAIDNALPRRFAVRGIPAGVLVKDGTVVWRGPPARLTEAMLEQHLGG